jgi:hypothetical protein
MKQARIRGIRRAKRMKRDIVTSLLRFETPKMRTRGELQMLKGKRNIVNLVRLFCG